MQHIEQVGIAHIATHEHSTAREALAGGTEFIGFVASVLIARALWKWSSKHTDDDINPLRIPARTE